MVELSGGAPPKVAKVVAVCAAMCMVTLAVYHGTTSASSPVEMFAQQGTPDLKTLLGKFMKEQGAKPSDIKEMQQYYAGDKAPEQMLDDISGEFDPINDYDSNYGRVLGVKEPSRTNGVVPEDMDVSPERKAPEQMLFDADGPQPTDPRKAFLARSAMASVAGRQAGREERDGNKKFYSRAETAGLGYETTLAAKTQKLDEMSEFDPINDYDSNYGRVLGVEEPSRTNGVVPEDMDVSPERKAPVQMLDDISGEFDPINDYDSNYGRVLGVKGPSRTNGVLQPTRLVAQPGRIGLLFCTVKFPCT